jgi:rod shape determining protein RodA
VKGGPSSYERRGWLSGVFSWRLAWWRIDWHILALALFLLTFGLFVVRAIALSDAEFNRPQPVVFGGHLQKVLVALPMLVVGMTLRPRWLRRNAWTIYSATIVLLLLVPLIGEARNNARRWIPIPGVGFDLQPSELAKIGLIVVLASVLYTSRLARWRDWRLPVFVALLPMGLVVLQPDLGTAMAMAPVSVGMFYVAGASGRRIAGIALGAALVGALAYQLEWIRDYQLERVDTWLDSVSAKELIDGRTGSAFHIYHARVAIGNGGWWGRGLGNGVANQAGHLPERDCDSVFAVIAEEAGFFGASGLLILYGLLVVLLLWSASQIRERFSRLVVAGVGLHFGAHAFVNVGVNLGLTPMTGLPLPLLSTGGSSMLATFAALGLALGLAAQREATLDEDAFRE